MGVRRTLPQEKQRTGIIILVGLMRLRFERGSVGLSLLICRFSSSLQMEVENGTFQIQGPP